MATADLIVRETVGETAHLCHADTLAPVCGTPAKRNLVTVRVAAPDKYVTCSKCRRLAGWPTLPGSYRARTSFGLDSSAWGANKGR